MTDAAELVREALAAARATPGRSLEHLRALLPDDDGGDAAVASVEEARAHISRLQRRAAELEALFSTARELVRLQDVDDVLRRLVERAHQLMGTDVTYLSEVEPGSGDLRVRHTAGTVTAGFRDLLVPAGKGLASKIVHTREPAWVRRYDAMSEAPHDSRIDDAVRAEGLVAFLGVPLAVGDEVLGALFACNRFAHDFTPDDVLLLSAFADHAAAVLRNARAIAEREAATARAEEAYRQLEEHLAATESAAAIHEELTTAVMSGGTVVDLVATVSRGLGRPVWALDADARVLAGDDGVLPPRAALASAMARAAADGHAIDVDAGGSRWLVAALLGAGRVGGALVTSLGDPPGAGTAGESDAAGDPARRTLERAAHVAALVSFQRDAVNAIRAERRAALLLDLLDGRTRPDAGSDPQLALPGAVSACAVIGAGGRSLTPATALAVELAGDDGLVAARAQSVLIAWAVPDAAARTERLRAQIAARLGEPELAAVVAGVDAGGPVAAADRAARDLAFLPALGVTATTVTSDTFAPYHVLASAAPGAATRFVADLLGGVLEWDATRGTELFDTLCAYFDAGESRQATAAHLHIHKNTVQQRLERIAVLLPGAWDDAEFRFRVQAAVRFERLARSLAASAP